ncbi:YybH family protein [Caballeronia grimmiae]|uniref:YybH family protein n=1 Tax=Caballeronia grimmiae TaxID=1071679 RepID=UPI0038B90F78
MVGIVDRAVGNVAICTLLAVSGTCAAAQGNPRAAIEAGNKRFEQAVARGDAPALADLYTENAELLPANGQVVNGRAAITKFWQAGMDSGFKSVKLTSVEVEPHGDTAYEVGKWAAPGEDGKVNDAGDYIVIWKRTNGQWKLHRDIWTTNSPPPKR